MHSRSALADGFRRLGVAAGDVVMMHASIRAVGEVAGGPADHCGQFGSVESDHAPRHHGVGGINELHHVAGLEISFDTGDAGREQGTAAPHHRGDRPVVDAQPAGRPRGVAQPEPPRRHPHSEGRERGAHIGRP